MTFTSRYYSNAAIKRQIFLLQWFTKLLKVPVGVTGFLIIKISCSWRISAKRTQFTQFQLLDMSLSGR